MVERRGVVDGRAQGRWRRIIRAATLRRFLAGLLLTAAVSACQADVTVQAMVEEDGSGEVRTSVVLDQAASDALLDLDLDEGPGLALEDLSQSGWVVEPPQRAADGTTTIVATKAFGTPEQFGLIMDELSGPDGPFQDFELLRRQRFAQVDYEITGVVDPTGGLDGFSDAALERALGRSVGALASRYQAEPGQVRIVVDLTLPGQVRDEPPAGLVEAPDGQLRATWPVSMADARPTPVVLRSATRQVAALALRGVAVVAGVLALLVVFAQLLRVLRPDRNRPRPPRPTSDIRSRRPSASGTDPREAAAPAPHADSAVRVLALDGPGVLYREADDVGNLLIPFARERGSSVPDVEIEARARALRLGRLTAAEFWASIAVPGEADDLDAAYLSRYQLTPGVIKYLRAQRDAGLRVACLLNDSPTWAYKLRAGHSLDGLIDPWVISGAVGVGKPSRPVFEVLRRVVGEPASAILVVDDDLDVLDAARRYGFPTLWFSPDGEPARSRGHRILRGFGGAAAIISVDTVSSPDPV